MNKIRAVIDQIEAEQRQAHQVDEIPDHISITELAEDVVRGKRRLTQPQMRMLIELLPYYAPKLSAVAVGWQKGEDFYTRLEKAVRIQEAKLIEGRVIERDD